MDGTSLSSFSCAGHCAPSKNIHRFPEAQGVKLLTQPIFQDIDDVVQKMTHSKYVAETVLALDFTSKLKCEDG